MSSKRGNQRRPARPAKPAKKLTEEEAAAKEEAFQKRCAAERKREREKDKYWGQESAFADAQSRDHTLNTF